MADPKLGLTVFLIKFEQLSDFDKTITKAAAAVPLAAPLDGVFVPFPTAPRTPPWAEAVGRLVEARGRLGLTSQSPAGILVLRHAGHTFAVTFGHAWQRLEDRWLEPDFGRRVALNAIQPDSVVEIRAEQVFAKWHLASERAPRASPVREFGVDFDRDLVAVVEGVSSDPLLGNTVRGGTSLRASLPMAKLVPLCDRAQKLFKSDAYKKRWPEVDNLTPVRSDTMVAALENRLDEDLSDGAAFPSLVLFTPSQRREQGMHADSYVFGRMSAQPAMIPYLTVDAWLNHLKRHGRPASVAEAKATRIHMLDEDNSPTQATSAFECFGYELALKRKQYVLSSGVWYEVVPGFLERINKTVRDIPAPKLQLPKWNRTDTEGDYNKKAAAAASYLHFDAKNVSYGGGASKFEFCDFMNVKHKTLCFAKIASKSSGMSHLVEQVRRTTELLFGLEGLYRSKLQKVFTKYHPTADAEWLDTRPKAGDWSMCLVSLGRPATSLPFFAKCSLAKLQRELDVRGHPLFFADV